MGSSFYSLFQIHCKELEKMGANMGKHGDKKLKGVLMVELLRREIAAYLEKNNEPFMTSAPNAYIAGSSYEYDLIIVKKNAEAYMGLVYRPEDVAAVIESKAGGLRQVDSETDSIAKSANAAIALNRDISFGYITLGEYVPVNDINFKTGNPTVNLWDDTYNFLKKKVHGRCLPYAVTLHKGGWDKIIDNGSDEEFEVFIKFLIGKADI